MPTPALYQDLGYAGFIKQSVQGTPLAPTKFWKLNKFGFVPVPKVSDYRNGNVVDIGFSMKESLYWAGQIVSYLYPDEGAAALAFIMGTDTKTGAGDPYTHTLALAAAIPYLTIEGAYYNNQIIDRVTDCKLSKLVIDAKAGAPVMLTLDALGCTAVGSQSPATVMHSDGSTEGPMMFYNGAFTLTGPSDATTLAAQIRQLTLTIDRNLSVEYSAGLTPIAIFEQGRKVSCKIQALFSGPAIYNLTHYGTSAGTTPANALSTGSVEAKFTSAASPEHSIDITLNNATWQVAKQNMSPDGKTGLIDLELVGFRSGATLPLVAVCKNAYATAYSP